MMDLFHLALFCLRSFHLALICLRWCSSLLSPIGFLWRSTLRGSMVGGGTWKWIRRGGGGACKWIRRGFEVFMIRTFGSNQEPSGLTTPYMRTIRSSHFVWI